MLNSFDEQLVLLLGQDALQNSERLARKLNVSSATVRRRLRKLIESDQLHIIGVVDPTKFGYSLRVMIALDVEHDKLEKITKVLANWPETRFVSITTGRYDIIAIAHFASTDNLSDFLANKLAKIEGLRNSETFVCLDVKKGRYVPLTRL